MTTDTDDFTVTQRSIDVQHGLDGPLVHVIGLDFDNRTPTYVPRKNLGSYGFKKIHDGMADHVRGEIPETSGKPVMYIGNNFGKYYWTSHSDTVPVDVLEWLTENGYTLVKNVDGGWDNWGGRPEFSENYVDFGDAEIVDMDSEIASRRE